MGRILLGLHLVTECIGRIHLQEVTPEPPPEPLLDAAAGELLLWASLSRAVLARASYVSPTRPFFCRSNSGERLTDGLCPISATSAMSADALAAAAPCLTAAARLASCAHTLSAIAAILIGSKGVSEVRGPNDKLLPGVPMILQEWLRG